MTKRRLISAAVCGVCLLAYLFKPTIVVRSSDASSGRSLASVGSIVSEPKLDPNLIRATQYFCEKRYHVESCLTYLNTCGKNCLDFLSQATKEKIRGDFEKLKSTNIPNSKIR